MFLAITVRSSVNALSPVTQHALYCAANQGPSCLDFPGGDPEVTTFWGGAYTTGYSEITYHVGGPTTWVAQTALKFADDVTDSPNAKTFTEVTVYDIDVHGK